MMCLNGLQEQERSSRPPGHEMKILHPFSRRIRPRQIHKVMNSVMQPLVTVYEVLLSHCPLVISSSLHEVLPPRRPPSHSSSTLSNRVARN